MKKITKWVPMIGCFILTLCAWSCDKSDDVETIFIGKTWRLTYLTRVNGNFWYKFPEVDAKNYEQYDPVHGIRAFYITFTGKPTDELIQGTWTTTGSVNGTGSWHANGSNQNFGASIQNSAIVDPTIDKLAHRIIEGLSRATSYGGNSQNLYLYYQSKENDESLCLVFTPVKK